METVNEKTVTTAKTIVADNVVINYEIENRKENKQLSGLISKNNNYVGSCNCSMPSNTCGISINEYSGLSVDELSHAISKFAEDVVIFMKNE